MRVRERRRLKKAGLLPKRKDIIDKEASVKGWQEWADLKKKLGVKSIEAELPVTPVTSEGEKDETTTSTNTNQE